MDESHVHLWIAWPDRIVESELTERYKTLLDEEERARYQRFIRPQDAHLYLVSHALVRSVLSRYDGTPPEKWRFVRNQHGRPEIVWQRRPNGLRFSLSHTKGMAACLVASVVDVGVDVERLDRVNDASKIAEYYFADEENLDLRRQPDAIRRLRFMQFWTLKEAYLKARGTGLSEPLKDCVFRVDSEGLVDVRFRGASNQDNPNAWQFALERPSSDHVMALAIHRGDRSAYLIEQRETIPLVD